MKKALLIAEKPSARRIIENVYEKNKSKIPYEIVFTEQRGHLLTMLTPSELDETLKEWSYDTLPIVPEKLGGFKYKPIEEKTKTGFATAKDRLNNIRKELVSGDYDFVIHAGDPDQEGQLLVDVVLKYLGNTLPVKRYWVNSQVETDVLNALLNLKDNDAEPFLLNLTDAAYGRAHSDYRIGMNISRVSTLKMNYKIACGRVKTPILAMVCKREDDISNYKPVSVYGVQADYDKKFSGRLFNQLDSKEDEEEKSDAEEKGIVYFETQEEAKKVISSLSKNGIVKKYTCEKEETLPPKLYKLATVQIAAGKKGYSASNTLEIIQGLYEKGYLSYPRCDCEYISGNEDLDAMLDACRSIPSLTSYIDTITSADINRFRHTSKWCNKEKTESSGHTALTPTTKKPEFSSLTTLEQEIYTMICRQFVCAFLPKCIQEKRTLMIEIDGKMFKSTGKTLIDPGFHKLLGTKFTDTNIPEMDYGDNINVENFSITTKTNSCPKHFTDALLTAACEKPSKFLDDEQYKSLGENLKIGTPATRAGIIEELIVKNKYLERKKEGKSIIIVPTEVGKHIYHNLKGSIITKVDMTGEWEVELEKIRNGELSLAEFEKSQQNAVVQMINDIKGREMEPLVNPSKTIICDCPKCGGDIISTEKSFYCSNYKENDCKVGGFKKICDSIIKDSEFKLLLDGETITKKISKSGKSWNQKLYYDFDECKVQFAKNETIELGYLCPNCENSLKQNGSVISCDCGFKLWTTVCGKDLTEEQIQKFFNDGHTGIIKGLRSKSGKHFDADVIITDDKMGSTFKFSDKR